MTAVLLFAKAPRPGLVKTRLARDIGDLPALKVYRSLGARVAAAVGNVYRITVWYEPHDAEGEMRMWLGDWDYRAQGEGNLGERMRVAFSAHFACGDRPVIVIGADTPGVDAAVIAEAEEALRSADAVFGPALDGGYYLIGLNRLFAKLFQGIPWGTATVLADTLERCQRVGVTVALLQPLRDVDTVTDLQALGLDSP